MQIRWKEHIEDLYDKSRKPSSDEMKPASVGKDSMGSDISYDKFEKKRNIKSTVWTVALYVAETWTLTKASKKLLEAFEMWMWQRMLIISWTEKVTNKEVLVCANEARSILKMICSK